MNLPPVSDMALRPDLERDLCTFARAMLRSQDLDPLYPVLAEMQGFMDEEQALWHSFLYVAFYDIGSAQSAFLAQPEPGPLPDYATLLPTGVERRNLRGGKVKRHVESYLKWRFNYANQQRAFWRRLFDGDAIQNWYRVQEQTQMIWGNGRWAAYKMADVLRYVNRFPLIAPIMGMKDASGPRQGLAMCYELDPTIAASNSAEVVDWLETLGWHLRTTLASHGVSMAIDQVETLMCDFHSLVEGRYYVGHDIDLMLESALRQPLLVAETILEARVLCLPHGYLGEANGWRGRQKERMRLYRDDGLIMLRDDGGRDVAIGRGSTPPAEAERVGLL